MNRRPARPARGFTIYEVTIVIVLSGLAMATLSSIFTSNEDMVEGARAKQRAESEHRRSVESLTGVLRGVAAETLGGFGPGGETTNPTFGRVTGADLTDFTYVGDEELRWEAAALKTNGVAQPGAVYLVRGGQRTLVADRVPAGGFRVRLDGPNLVVALTTFYAITKDNVAYRTSETVVAVRN
jgi:hypothetical protein